MSQGFWLWIAVMAGVLAYAVAITPVTDSKERRN